MQSENPSAESGRRPQAVAGLAVWLLVTFGVSAIGGAVTYPAIGSWYSELEKPPFNPPNWVFGPVWSLLYALMAVAVWRATHLTTGKHRAIAARVYLAQLGANLLWSIVFFGLHSPVGGLVVIVLLWFLIAWTIRVFAQIDGLAAWLLSPYLAWVSFATLLNAAIVSLNP